MKIRKMSQLVRMADIHNIQCAFQKAHITNGENIYKESKDYIFFCCALVAGRTSANEPLDNSTTALDGVKITLALLDSGSHSCALFNSQGIQMRQVVFTSMHDWIWM